MSMTNEKETILIVDDEEGIRSQIKWAMNSEYNIMTAESVEEAMAINPYRLFRP